MWRPWAVWGNDVLTAEWATAEVRNEWSSMKPGIFMDVEVQNWRLSIDNGLFVDAVDWICCLSMKPGIFMDVEVRN